MKGSHGEAADAKLREKMSAEVIKVRSKPDSAATRHHELLVSFRRIVEPHKKCNGTAANTLTKLRKVYDKGRTVRVVVHVAEWYDYLERVASSTSVLESKALKLEVLSGFASDGRRLRPKLAEARTDVDDRNEKLASMGQVLEEVPSTRRNLRCYCRF